MLAIAGNFEEEKVLKLCDKMLKPSEAVTVRRVFPEEPDTVVNHQVEEQLSVALPLFQFGFKEPKLTSPVLKKTWPLQKFSSKHLLLKLPIVPRIVAPRFDQ